MNVSDDWINHDFIRFIVGLIPPMPYLSTYSMVGTAWGNPKKAQAVGNALAWIEQLFPGLYPTHRIICSNGTLSDGYPGGAAKQAKRLRADGFIVDEFRRGEKTIFHVRNFQAYFPTAKEAA